MRMEMVILGLALLSTGCVSTQISSDQGKVKGTSVVISNDKAKIPSKMLPHNGMSEARAAGLGPAAEFMK